MVASVTGGIGSFAAIWLVVVPLEAALSASRRVVATASILALAAAGLLVLLGSAHHVAAGWRPPRRRSRRWASFRPRSTRPGLRSAPRRSARTSFWLLYAEEDRYRLLARNMTDVITRHGRDGAVLFVSPAAEQLFGLPVSVLLNHGLFDRVHVADRPAYLTALGDAGALGESRSVEFRVRRDSVDAAGARHRAICVDRDALPAAAAGDGGTERTSIAAKSSPCCAM